MKCRFMLWFATFASLACIFPIAAVGATCESSELYGHHPGGGEREGYLGNSVYVYTGDLTLHTLVREGKTSDIRLLIEAGLDPNVFNKAGLTPLHVAAVMKHPDIVDIVTLLLDGGADPNLTSGNEGYPCRTTPLHWASYSGHRDIATALLNAGADKNAAAADGLTPIDWANAGSQADVLLLLLKHGKEGKESGGQDSKKIVAPE